MAWYSAGTITVTNGSGSIAGSGTAFVDAGLKAGMAFIGPDLLVRQITAVVSNTQLTVTPPWNGGTSAGQGYMILPTSSMAADLTAAVQQLIQTFASVRDGVGQGLFPDGTAAAPAFRFLLDQDTGFARGGVDAIAVIAGGKIVAGFTIGSATLGTNLFSDGVMELGYNGQGDRTSFIDFHSDDTFSDFGFRILKNAGANGGAQLLARGTGGLQLVTIDASNVSIGAGNLLRWQFGQDGAFLPFTDASYDVGGAGNRVNVVYAAGGVNTTSDERLKQWRGGLTDAELAAAKEIAGSIGIYQWLTAIAAKGADSAPHANAGGLDEWRALATSALAIGGKP